MLIQVLGEALLAVPGADVGAEELRDAVLDRRHGANELEEPRDAVLAQGVPQHLAVPERPLEVLHLLRGEVLEGVAGALVIEDAVVLLDDVLVIHDVDGPDRGAVKPRDAAHHEGAA